MQTPLRPGDMCFAKGSRSMGVMCIASVPHNPRSVVDSGGSLRRTTVTYVLVRYLIDVDGNQYTKLETCERDEQAFRSWMDVDEL